jgi:hypothetical protein
MMAADLVQAVEKMQRQLRDELASVVSQRLNELSEATGLDLGRVEFYTIESTCLNSAAKEWAVTHVTIDYGLPRMISMEYP